MQRYLVKGRADAVVKVFKFAKPTHADYYYFFKHRDTVESCVELKMVGKFSAAFLTTWF